MPDSILPYSKLQKPREIRGAFLCNVFGFSAIKDRWARISDLVQPLPLSEKLTKRRYTMADSASAELAKAPRSESIPLIDFEVAEVRPGFVNNTFFLFVSGTKPYINMTVRLVPVVYVRQPEYWQIDVVGILPNIGLPMLGPYAAHLDLTNVLGTKGIEVVGATRSERIDIDMLSRVPSNIGKWHAKIDASNKPQIKVNGIFPTNGERPLFDLKKAEPQGINPTELILDLQFGSLADPNGTGEASVHYSEIVGPSEDFRTVLVRDENSRTIANIDVV